MSHPVLTDRSFELLRELHNNNHRDWFHPRKDEFKEFLQIPFAEILEAASKKLKNRKLFMSGGRDTMFRIYRDVRFSKDKRPYKENVSGLLTPSGTKNMDDGLVYVHLDVEGGFLASGFHQLRTDLLNRIRDRIVSDSSLFKRIVKKIDRSGYEFSQDDKLKTMPRGYRQCIEHEHLEFLKLKSLVIMKYQAKEAWLDGSIVDQICEMNKVATDFTYFGLEALDASG